MNGSGRWHAEQAWLGHRAENVLIEVEDGLIKTITEGAPAPRDAVVLKGWTIPGLANVHSHAFQRLLRGEVESGGGDFWEWRDSMYGFAQWDPADYFNHARLVFREMLEAGITSVGARGGDPDHAHRRLLFTRRHGRQAPRGRTEDFLRW